MTLTSSSLQVICRPALPRDRADVVDFCREIWEGEDYVPDVWARWYADPDGLLAVAEYGGHAIGCAKVSLISKGQWWLEGFRVDPKHQGLKVGSLLHNYVTDWWLNNGEGTVRLMTDAKNFAVHHLCEKTGYHKIFEVCGYQAFPIAEPTENFSAVIDRESAAKFAVQSKSLQATGELVDFGWRIGKPDPQALENHAHEKTDYRHAFHWWKNQQGLFSAREDQEEEERTLFLGVVACALSDLPALLTDVRRFAAAEGFDSVFQIAFDIPQITQPLLAAGFEKHWKRNAFIFEKRHPSRI